MLLADGAIGASRQKNKFLVLVQVKIASVQIVAPLTQSVLHWDLALLIQICQIVLLFVKGQYVIVP